MIKRFFELSEEITEFLSRYPVKTVATAALSQTYSLSGSLFSLYGQFEENELTAIVSIYGNGMHIALGNNANKSELIDFIGFSAPTSLHMDSDDYAFFDSISGFSENRASLLAMKKPSLALGEIDISVSPSLREVYSLLNEYLDMSDGDSFVADMQARINHMTGRAVALQRDGKIVAAACVFFESEYCGFLGGVATHSDYRGKGYASALVSCLCRDLILKNTLPLLSCTNPAAKRVYISLGFEEINENITLIRSM